MGQSSDAGAFYKRDSGRPFDLRLERRLGPALFTAVDDKTGNILWRHRSFLWASFLLADGRFIILDEDGHLLLATATREGLTVTSKAELLSNQSWTVSSLSGTRLYLRDRKNIIAVDLGRQ